MLKIMDDPSLMWPDTCLIGRGRSGRNELLRDAVEFQSLVELSQSERTG